MYKHDIWDSLRALHSNNGHLALTCFAIAIGSGGRKQDG
jgi:hypothetical protein